MADRAPSVAASNPPTFTPRPQVGPEAEVNRSTKPPLMRPIANPPPGSGVIAARSKRAAKADVVPHPLAESHRAYPAGDAPCDHTASAGPPGWVVTAIDPSASCGPPRSARAVHARPAIDCVATTRSARAPTMSASPAG